MMETTAVLETTATEMTEMVTPGKASRIRPREESSPTGDTPPPRMTRVLSPEERRISVGSGDVRPQFTLNPNPIPNPSSDCIG